MSRDKGRRERKERERDRGLNAGRKKQRLGTKVASAGETSEYGDAAEPISRNRAADIVGREVGGVCKYFSSPHGKPGPSFPASSFARLSPVRITALLFLLCRFFSFLSRAFHAAFFFRLSLSFSRRVYKK